MCVAPILSSRFYQDVIDESMSAADSRVSCLSYHLSLEFFPHPQNLIESKFRFFFSSSPDYIQYTYV